MGRLAEEAGALLRAERERQGKTLRDMAAELGLSNPTLFHYESGQGNPTLGKLEEIAAGYGITLGFGGKRLPRTAPKSAPRSTRQG